MKNLFTLVLSCLSISFLAMQIGLAEGFDANSTDFDSEKQFVITPHGAIMGDPVQLKVISNNKVAFTVVTVTPSPNGLMTMLSIIEPQQNGEPGGGYGLILSSEQVDLLKELLLRTQTVPLSELENYGEHHKLVGHVALPDIPSGEIAILFKADDVEKSSVRIVQIIGGTPSLFEFTPNGVQKLIKQIDHFVDKAEKQAEATKL